MTENATAAWPGRQSTIGLLVLVALATPALADEPRLVPVDGAWPVPGEPVAVVVHGIRPAPGQLDPLLAEVAARGYRTYAFHYDDDADLDQSAEQLDRAVARVFDRWLAPRRLAIVAHSMGGLVSRRALTRRHPALGAEHRTRLLTIASPFGGFRSADFARFDFGLGPASHDDLGRRSAFIREPGLLRDRVQHFKLETLEAGHVHHLGRRPHGDSVVSPANQRQPEVDQAASQGWRFDLGHVGVVNAGGVVPEPTRGVLEQVLGPALAPVSDTDRDWAAALRAELDHPPCEGCGVRRLSLPPDVEGVEVRLDESLRAVRLVFPTAGGAKAYAAWIERSPAPLEVDVEARGREVLLLEGAALWVSEVRDATKRAGWAPRPTSASQPRTKTAGPGFSGRLQGVLPEGR